MKKMTKVISLMTILVLILSAVGCSSKETTETTNPSNGEEVQKEATTIEAIKAKGKLVVGTSADYPPYEFIVMKNGKDEIVGFDMDIAKAVADDLGVALEIVDMDFGGLLAALTAGKVDIVVAGMTPKPERLESADFTNIYYTASHGVVVAKGKEDSIKTLDDLDGKIIGVQQGSIQADIAFEEVNNPKEVKELPKITDLVLMLQTGKVDAIIVELPVAQSYVKNNDKIALTSLEIVDGEGGSAIAVKKGSPTLVEAMNKTIDRLIAEDKITEFFNKATELQDQNQ